MKDDTKTGVPKPLRHEIASVRRDVAMPVWGNVMLPQDDVLVTQGNGRGVRIYQDIGRDPHAFAVLQKRKVAVVARSWTVEPGGPGADDEKAAQLAERWLAGEWGFAFDRTSIELLDALLIGYSVGEAMWHLTPEGFVVPREVRLRSPQRFTFDPEGRPRLITFEDMVEGEQLPPRKFVVHRCGHAPDDPYGRGLGHQLFWPVLFKRQGLAFWLVFAEKFGSPTVMAEYPETMLDDAQQKLLETISNLSQESAMIFPNGVVAKFLEASRSGTVTYPDLVRYMDEQISEAVLGETLSTNAGERGARSLGEVHNEVRAELTDGDADLLCGGPFNEQLLPWITEINYPGAAPPKVWRPRPAREEDEAKVRQERAKASKLMLEFVEAMRAAGYEPAEEADGGLDAHFEGQWAYTGRKAPPPQAVVAPPQPLAFADPASRDAADDLAGQAEAAAGAIIDQALSKVRELVASAASLEEVADGLLALYPAMPRDELAALMEDAMVVANLTGRAEIIDG
ncbi:MAG: DUF935 family protein [Pseudomonadota bacterium]